VEDAVRHVDKIRLSSANEPSRVDCLAKGEVRGMRFVAKGAQNQGVDTPETFNAGFRDLAGISHVCEATNSESCDRQGPVQDVETADIDRLVRRIPAGNPKRVADFRQLKFEHPRIGTIDKNVVITPSQNGRRTRVGENGNRSWFVQKKSPKVVKAGDVIEMLVRNENGVDPLESGS